MPSFFSASANKLTEWSGYYVDWSRVGELIAAGRHHYTWEQLAQRGVIVAATAVGGYAGFNYEQDDENSSRGFYSMAGCFIGFVVSHVAVIAPLLYKRHQMKTQCIEYEKKAVDLLQTLKLTDIKNDQIDKLIHTITLVIYGAKSVNLSDDKHARASQTLGKRLGLLEQIVDKLTIDIDCLSRSENKYVDLNKMMAFWSKDLDGLFQALQSNSIEESVEKSDEEPGIQPAL